jgi:cation transport regulator ChaC
MKAPKIVGRKYRVINAHHPSRMLGAWRNGTVLTLIYDDGTGGPVFKGPPIKGETNFYFLMERVELLPENYTEPADRTSRIAELEKELEQLKREEAKEVAPWLRFKNGDKVRVSFKGVVASVEHENYVGELQIKVRFAKGKSAWLTHKDVELIEE